MNLRTIRTASQKAIALGMAGLLATNLPAPAQTFSSAGGTNSFDDTTATPYPLNINVSGLQGQINQFDVRILNRTATSFDGDLKVLLVGPGGQSIFLYGGNNGGGALGPVTWTFSPNALALIPLSGAGTGTYLPNASDPNLAFTGNPSAPPYGEFASFAGLNPNGTWSLFLLDSVGGGAQQIGSWELIFQLLLTSSPELAEKLRQSLVRFQQLQGVQQSGLLFALTQGQLTQSVVNTALRDVGGRLFSARAGEFGLSNSLGLAGNHAINTANAAIGFLGAFPSAKSESSATTNLRGALGYVGLSTGKDYQSGKAIEVSSKEIAMGRDYRWRVYAQGDMGFTNVDEFSDYTGADTETYAPSTGVEYWVASNFRFGLNAGYMRSAVYYDNDLGNMELDGINLTTYATTAVENLYFDLLYSYGNHTRDLKRNTPFGYPAYANNVNSETQSAQFNLGYNFKFPGLVTGPFAQLQYIHGDIDGYTESARDRVATLTVSDQYFDSLVSRIGWQATGKLKLNLFELLVQARVAWAHESLAKAQAVSLTVPGVPSIVPGVTGTAPAGVGADSITYGRDWMEAGVGCRFDIGEQWSVLADYGIDAFRTSAFTQYASLQVSFSF